jgi:small subunit ribosomal protein S7
MSVNLSNLKNNSNENFFIKSFLGNLVKCGNKNKAFVVYINLLEKLKTEYPDIEPSLVLVKALEKIKPLINLRAKKVAGISYQLPCPLDDKRSSKMAVNWFFNSIKQRGEPTLNKRVIAEVLDILNDKGSSLQRKYAHEKTALDNRAFLFFLKR